MARRLNLRMPTLKESVFQKTMLNESKNEPRSPALKSSESLKIMRESLDKTSEKLRQIHNSKSVTSPQVQLKSPTEMEAEIFFLKGKIEKLEKER